jgi:cytochrome c oxidase subunit 2
LASQVRPRRLLAVGLLAVAVLLVLAPVAGADILTPESGGSPNADRVDTLYKVVFGVGFLVFLGVEGALIYALVKHRYRRGAPEPVQTRDNTPVEIFHLVWSSLLLLGITALTFVMLPSITNPEKGGGAVTASSERQDSTTGLQFAALNQSAPPGGRRMQIKVNGQQYLWRFDYPGAGAGLYTYSTMVVPVDTTITLDITSQDVQHSWWIPKLGGKADAVPGHSNQTWFKIPADKAGTTFAGHCAELCGENHAQMIGYVKALPMDEWLAWRARTANELKQAQSDLIRLRQQRVGPQNEVR